MALNKGKPGVTGYKALLSHCLIHGAGTMILMGIFAPGLWWLGIVDVAGHAFIDRLKGLLTCRKGWQPTDRWFWWSFGLDQEAHNLIHLAYILIVLANKSIVFI